MNKTSIVNQLSKLILTVVAVIVCTSSLYAQPCYTGYDYRQPIYLDNSLNAETENLQIEVTINTASLISAGKLQSTGSDLRILDRFGNPLSFWIEDGTINSASTNIWVKTDSIIGYAVDTIYIYYGNSSAASESNKASTFDIYDDFTGSSLGIGWSTCGAGSTVVSGGSLTLSSTGANKRVITSVASFAGPLVVEMGVSTSSGGTNFIGVLNSSNVGYALVHNTNMGIQSLTTANCFTGTSVNTAVASGTVNGTWSFLWENLGTQKGTWPGGTSAATSTTIVNSANNKITFGNGGGGSLVIDWIRARRYSANVIPQTIGTEVSMVYTINPSYNSPLCEGEDLNLSVNAIAGATYRWTGPAGSGFTSSLRQPVINGVNSLDNGQYSVEVTIPSGCASRVKTVNVSVTAESEGGALSGSTTVCSGSNTGSLTLNGQVGNIIGWDTSNSVLGPWSTVASTSNSRSYLDLSSTTYYRAIVKNGTCKADTSLIGSVNVTPASSGGTISGATTVCAGSNSGVLNLTGNVGNIERWEQSLNGFLWTNIVNRSTIHAYSNLSQTTFYRAVAKNGLCDEAVSSPVTISVDAQSIGGTVSGVSSTCQGSNQGVLNLSGQLGSIIRWETSTSGSSPWTAVTNTTDSFQFSNITVTTYYRAIVKNGSCNLASSSSSAVSIIPSSDAGSIAGSATVCESGNSGTLSASGFVGTIEKWQYNSPAISGWQDISNTTSTLTWGSLTDSTDYRIIVSNMGCEADTSAIATINVNKTSQSGYLTGVTGVCSGVNSGTIALNSNVGTVERWEVSNTGFAPWSTIVNTTTSQTFSNLLSNTYYRAIVKNGVCSQTTSNPFTVKVDQPTLGGFTNSDLDICAGTNYGLIGLASYNGDILRWEKAEDSAAGPWSPITNFTNRQDFRDLGTTTYYRAVVKSGSCNSANSSITTIRVSEPTVGGIIEGDTSFCASSNAGVVSVNNIKGDVIRWEYSTSGTNPWITIPNTTTANSYSNLASTTFFRAIVKNGACSQIESPVSVIGVFPASSSGVLSSMDTSTCDGSNFGSISLTGYDGNIQKWESSTDNGATWNLINNTTSLQYFFNLKETKQFRAFVQNAECDAEISNTVTIKVDSTPVGGFIDPLTESCITGGVGTIKLNDYSGNINKWQMSSSLAGPWTDISNTNDNLNFINPVNTIYYRAEIDGGACGTSLSQPGELRVYESTEAGTVVGGGAVCDSSNSGELLLTNNKGVVVDWESSNSNIGPWVSESNISASQTYFNVDKETYYRVLVKNGICSDSYSNIVRLTIDENPVADYTVSNLCGGEIATFKDNSSVAGSTITDYFWSISDGYSTGQEEFSKAFVNPGKFLVTLQVKADNGCVNLLTREIEVNESPLGNFIFEGDLGNGATCTDDSITFNNLTNVPVGEAYSYTWSFGDGTTSSDVSPSKVYENPGTYNVKLNVSNSTNCKDSLDRWVTVYQKVKPLVGEDRVVSMGIGTRLNATGGISYAWTPANKLDNANSSTPVATIAETTEFIVEALDINGCKAKDSVTLEVIEDYKVRASNVITPEGNLENDVWIISNIENYPDNTVSVFDRWGRVVYTVSDYQNDWGATDESGALLMDGTYYYVITFDNSDDVYKGAITVVRNK